MDERLIPIVSPPSWTTNTNQFCWSSENATVFRLTFSVLVLPLFRPADGHLFCAVYRIPPRQSSKGYRAADWGDMEAFLWKGRLRIISKGNQCFIRLEDSGTGET
ncbi:hypothetical protein BC936DRAFT_142801 [Jimgerdemannia flammicorona]|uniref:NECAP PHear domain-containing protein n=1 Tax=Jimgerdemannia flammicorona TaxID=994334 RepID=A0A433A046_9FUNG|nr:hypothetical protein BC936DRAFT_142801 [Jimgerdemannia flammicorona]